MDTNADGGVPSTALHDGLAAPLDAPEAPEPAEHEISLRSSGTRELLALDLPLYAQDPRAMLRTVGGLETLQRTHEGKAQFLGVRLRPNEPSCKPLFADLAKTQTLLVRVVRRKPKRVKTEEESDREAKVRVELVGLVRDKYVCEGMADFQYLTARRFFPREASSEPAPGFTPPSTLPDPTVDVSSHVWPASEAQRALKASLRPYMAVEREEELEMVPEVFSKVDLPLKYEFRQRSGYQPSEGAKKAASTMTYLNFHDDAAAPLAPRGDQPAALRRRSVGASDGIDERVADRLALMLEQKPVWLRSKLFAGLDAAEKRAARRVVRRLCYVFVDGPWRGSWIRMGFDPRSSPAAAKFQVVELRNNRELVHAKVTHPSRKRTKKFAHLKGPRIAKVTQTSASDSAQASKRRRKERFTRGETRRSYLVSPDAAAAAAARPAVTSPPASEASRGDEQDESSEDDRGEVEQLEVAMDAVQVSAARATTQASELTGSATTYEIFGVQLSSANVLFQLDEIDDEEVKAWTAHFSPLETPSLLGGWYSTHMFLPLREMIRCRIAALVGRSKAELETRRSRLEALKKQALADYADERAGVGKKRETKGKADKEGGDSGEAVGAGGDQEDAAQEDAAQEEEELAFERSLARQHVVGEAAVNGEASAEEKFDEDLMEGRAQHVDGHEDEEMEEESGRRRRVSGVQDEEEMQSPSSPSGASEASTNFSGGELGGLDEDEEDEEDAGPDTEYVF